MRALQSQGVGRAVHATLRGKTSHASYSINVAHRAQKKVGNTSYYAINLLCMIAW